MTTPKKKTDEVATLNPGDIINKQMVSPEYVPESFNEYTDYLGGDIADFVGSPYTVVEKAELIGKPFIITDMRWYEGKYGAGVVAVMAITVDDERVVFNDGSTGIYKQVIDMVVGSGRKSGIRCMNGLRVSEYEYEDESGHSIPAATYYVA